MENPAQTLCNRVIATWVNPELIRRIQNRTGTTSMELALTLILWNEPSEPPCVYINHEVNQFLDKVELKLTGSLAEGQNIKFKHIVGLKRAQLYQSYWSKGYILICQGHDEKYYVIFNKIWHLNESDEFKRLKSALASDGVRLKTHETYETVALDLVKNSYVGSPAQKKRTFIELRKNRIERDVSSAKEKVRRHLKLPTFVIQPD